jgi:hypothetical protein
MKKIIGKDKRADARGYLIARCACLVIASIFLLYAIVLKQPCDLDAQFLSCRLTGSVFDYIGSAMFLFGLVVLSGIIKGVRNLYSPPGSSKWNLLWFAFMIAGPVIFWNL